MAEKNASNLRFEGSVWCNMDIALRNIEQAFGRDIRQMGLSVIELYILRALYHNDGQYASELAHSVGRAATSFTPNLDKLQQKALIERRADPRDRRAVRIHLTEEAMQRRESILNTAKDLDNRLAKMFRKEEFDAFLNILSALQSFDLE